MKERGYEGLVAKDPESTYRSGPTRSWIKVKIRREGRFVLCGILGLPQTFAGILVGQRVGRRLVFRGTVEWGLGIRTAQHLLAQSRPRTTSPFPDFRLARGVRWLEPTLHVELTYSEIMDGRLRDPVAASPDVISRLRQAAPAVRGSSGRAGPVPFVPRPAARRARRHVRIAHTRGGQLAGRLSAFVQSARVAGVNRRLTRDDQMERRICHEYAAGSAAHNKKGLNSGRSSGHRVYRWHRDECTGI